MNFNRYRVQQMCENAVGCSDISKWPSYQRDFENLCLNHNQAIAFQMALFSDAEELFSKGLLSLCEAIIERQVLHMKIKSTYFLILFLSLMIIGCASFSRASSLRLNC
ncbi:MAG: hypothetical protein GY749_30835 [Desulfobacteraceae bacterium]|nr:hypothetical protein [Desulfobacteraceae bacterium]